MKRSIFVLIMLAVFVMTSAMTFRRYPIFSDTVKSTGDSVTAVATAEYMRLTGSYHQNLFNDDCMKLLFYMDTVAAASDSQEIILNIKYRYPELGVWSAYDSLAYILNADSLRLPLIYDIPARMADAMHQ